MSASGRSDPARRQVLALTGALFLSYLAVAMSLPAVSMHVVDGLGLGNLLGGLAVGIAFLATVATRGLAGSRSDRGGGKLCMRQGLGVYVVAELVCLLSGLPVLGTVGGYAALLAGRILLGLGESLVMVGMIGWSIGLMGAARSGQVMALVGMGVYGAFVAGGPMGLALLEAVGFPGLMAVCAALPALGLAVVARFPGVPPHPGADRREPFWKVVVRIRHAGAVVGLQGIGFAALGAFFPLLFLSRGWGGGGMGLAMFGTGFVVSRLLFGRLPDRIGGVPVAVASLAVEAVGQILLWVAPAPWVAILGALLTGLGCSMVFPAMGAMVVRQVPPHLRSTAVGGFAGFQDVAYGLTGPVAGLLADHVGYPPVFLVGATAAILGIATAARADRRPRDSRE